jgi:hypothetical protein
MSYESLKKNIIDKQLPPAKYHHRARLWRVAENIQANAQRKPSDDRLLHLMSRVGDFSREVAADLNSGEMSSKEAAMLLGYLADMGDISFEQWLHGD